MCSLFACFMLVFNDPTSPTPYPVDAKGPVHHPQSLHRGKYSPGFLQLPSGRPREAALTPGCLGMYCYANVNFTRGCWVLEGVCLFCQQKQQKVHTWSSLLHFVTRICNYAFSEKGKGGKRGKEVDLHLYVFPVSVSMVSPRLRGKRRRGSPGQHSEGKRDLPDPALWQV